MNFDKKKEEDLRTVDELMKKGIIYKTQGHYPDALDTFDAVVTLLTEEELGSWAFAMKKIGEAMFQTVEVLQDTGNYKAALSNLLHLVAYYKSAAMPLQMATVGLAHCYLQIALCKLASGKKPENVLPDFKKAEQVIYVAISLSDAKETGNLKDLGSMHYLLAQCDLKIDCISCARVGVHDALKIFHQIKYKEGIAQAEKLLEQINNRD